MRVARLIARVNLQAEAKLHGLSPVGKTALSGLLVVLFLLSGTLAASTALHESLHKDGSASLIGIVYVVAAAAAILTLSKSPGGHEELQRWRVLSACS